MTKVRGISVVLCVLVLATAGGPGCIHDPFGLLDETVEWEIAESEHFVYQYQTDDPDAYLWHVQAGMPDGTTFDPTEHSYEECISVYLDTYEFWFDALVSVFGVEPDEPIHVYTYNNDTQQGLVGNFLAGGTNDYQRINGDGLAVHTTAGVHPHELVHVFQSLHGEGAQVWREGLAVALADGFAAHIDDDRYYYRAVSPSLPLPDRPDHDVAYAEGITEEAFYFIPLHRAAAMRLGMDDPEYELRDDQIWPDVRPSQLRSPANFYARDIQLVYVLGGSFVHYLVRTHGWEPFMELSSRSSLSGLAGEDLHGAFEDVYGIEIAEVEQAWLDYLRSQPSEYWDAPVTLVVRWEDL